MTNTPAKKEDDNSKLQAQAQLESIRQLVQRLKVANSDATDDEEEREAIRTAIEEDALSVEVRSDWYLPGQLPDALAPSEYRILLCTGGPAVQIVGSLDKYSQPESARLQHQDWFTPWTDLPLTAEDEKTLLAYAGVFYYGEG